MTFSFAALGREGKVEGILSAVPSISWMAHQLGPQRGLMGARTSWWANTSLGGAALEPSL